MKKSIFHIMAAMPLLTGCLLEYPEMTEDGELGVDPTSVNVCIDISADLRLGGEMPDYQGEDSELKHRITVAVYDERTRMVERENTVYAELSEDGNLDVEMDFRLHAKEYRFVVWADLESEGESGAYYNIDDLTSILYADNNYRGQTVAKDALYASCTFDFSEYEDKWNGTETVEMELERPMGAYELVATDVQKFLSKIEAGTVTGETFTVRVNYDGFLPAGFNAYDGIAKHAFRYLTYRRTIRVPDDDTEELSLVFDYVFMDGDKTDIPLTVDILDEDSNIIASMSLTIACTRNEMTQIRRSFLTSLPGDGVGIDDDFEDSEDIDIGII